MEVSGYVRGIPTYEDLNGKTYGMLCETKEKCITDDTGVALDFKLEELRKQIESGSGNTNASTLEGHNAAYFATAESVTNITNGTTQVGNAKTLDGHEAGYFFSKSGEVDTPLFVENTENADGSFIQFSDTSGRRGDIGIYSNGQPYFKKAGANWYQMLHTGNMADHVLPKSGGRVENVTFGEALKVKRTDAYDSVTTYENSTGVLGYIGMGNTEKPIYTDKTKAKTYEILHTGNSAKVVVSQTAPSDTNALWVW